MNPAHADVQEDPLLQPKFSSQLHACLLTVYMTQIKVQRMPQFVTKLESSQRPINQQFLSSYTSDPGGVPWLSGYRRNVFCKRYSSMPIAW